MSENSDVNIDIYARHAEMEETIHGLHEENALMERASRRFEELFQGLPIACFCFDTRGQIFEWNRACEILFRFSPDVVFQRYVWEVIGRPEDWEITKALISSVVSGETYESFEWEGVDPDGTLRYFLCNTFPLKGPNGSIAGGISANVDINGRKIAEQALRESEERWQLAVKGTDDGIWDWNARTDRTVLSHRCRTMIGLESGDILASRKDWLQRVHPEDLLATHQAFDAHLSKKCDFYNSEYRIMCKDGTYKWILDRGQALWSRSGDVLRVAGSFTDITDRKHYENALHEANAKLEALAIRDGLTGLTNHRGFQDHLHSKFEQLQRESGCLSVVFLDVDKFKNYNDSYGHPAGDEVLRRVAVILESCIKDTDIAARYGGEEFVLVLSNANMHEAVTIAEQCRSAIEAYPWAVCPVTASFGVSTANPEFASGADLITAADQALYHSKTSGRNRVTHHASMLKQAA